MRTYILILALLSSAQLCPPAHSQFGVPQKESPAEKLKKSKAKFKTQAVTALRPIPNVPAYPAPQNAQKFIRAQQYSALGQGDNCIVQSFLLRDPPDTVREFYRTQLTNNGWMLQPANAAGTQLLARRRKDGSSCHVMVAPSPEKGWKSFVQLRYVQFHPLED